MAFLPRSVLRRLALCWVALTPALVVASGTAHSVVLPTKWNNLSTPTALYGGCGPAGTNAGLGSKPSALAEAGVALTDVLAVTVLRCEPFGSFGGSGAQIVACPTGSPFTLCVENGNDGLGNAYLFGVLKRGVPSNPTAPVCGDGARVVDLISRVGEDPRLVNGAVTLQCSAATGNGVRKVACPAGPTPFAYCIEAKNDGKGRRAIVGIVAANGPSDPYGLYGQCHAEAKRGYLPKNHLITAVGADPSKVLAIDLTVCNLGRGFGSGFPANLQKVDCAATPYMRDDIAPNYDYCIVGTDSLLNSLVAGVITRK